VNTTQIVDLFKSYMDEPDATFVTTADVSTYLDRGLSEFRQRSMEQRPDMFLRDVVITVNGATSYDLSSDSGNPVTITGAAPIVTTTVTLAAVAAQPIIIVASTTGLYVGQPVTLSPTGFADQTTSIASMNVSTNTVVLAANLVNPMTAGDAVVAVAAAMVSLNMVRMTNAAGTERGAIWRAVAGLRGLDTGYETWCLRGSVLTFSENVTHSFLLSYQVHQTVDWTSTSGYVGPFVMFHDLIALYAYKQYAIRDGALNEPLMFQLQVREKDFKEHMATVDYEASQYVNRVEASYDTY
jgi:hypothetical protein